LEFYGSFDGYAVSFLLPYIVLINSHGEIARVFENARPAKHSAEILETLKNLSL